MLEQVKIAVLGAPAVGKTSLIYQFVFCYFPPIYHPTTRRSLFRPNVITGDRMVELNILDAPQIVTTDTFNLREWAELQYRGEGIRDASGYLLVYDVSSPVSFQYVQVLRDKCMQQKFISSTSTDVPIVVLGNKRDLERDTRPLNSKQPLASLIRKSWKCEYLECSALFNWNVCSAFQELLDRVTTHAANQPSGSNPNAKTGMQQMFERLNGSRRRPLNREPSLTQRHSRCCGCQICTIQ